MDTDREALLRVARSMLESGKGIEALDVLAGAMQALQHDNLRLLIRLAAANRARFGRSSEKLNAEQLKQLMLAFGATPEQAEAQDPLVPVPQPPTADEPSADSAPAAATTSSKEKRRNHPGRLALSPELPREITNIPVPAEERACIHCGIEMECIGHLDSETVEFVPARLVVHVERREKLACKSCEQDITTAPRVASEPHQSRAGASLLAHLLESKCDDALPIYRQQDQLRRLGFNVPLNTLYGYWSYVTELLQPVADAIVSTVLGSAIVGVDDTKLDFLDPADPRGKQRGHLWCFVGTGSLVGFVFTETWSAEDIEPWLSAIDGFIQCDDYKGYSSKIVDDDGTSRILVPPDRRLGCMMHVRRPFKHALNVGYHGAGEPLMLLQGLYKIEDRAKAAGLSAPERLALRQRESLPLLAQFDAWVDEWKPKLLPTSPLAVAARYSLEQREFVHRCFTDGRFEIDNGRVEREIREPAVGRKNFLFAGSAEAAGRLAGAYTLVQSARRTGIPVREYLVDIIGRIEKGWPARRLTELLPDRWAALRAAEQAVKQPE